MTANESHESYTRDERIERPPDRQFGLVFTVVFVVLAVWPALRGRPVRWWSAGLAAAFLILALVAPRLLGPLNRLWLRIGQVLHVGASYVFLTVIFFAAVTPIGLLLRLLGKDPLQRRFDARASTYWIERRPPGPVGDTMPNQF
jgi:hypothetical protein